MMAAAEFWGEVRRIIGDELQKLNYRKARFATVDPAYTTGLPLITFDGEATMSTKGYAHLDSYTPAASDRVLLLPAGTTYIIVGLVVS